MDNLLFYMFDALPSDKISVFSVLQSVIPPAVLPTIVPSCAKCPYMVKIHSQKMDAILSGPCSYNSSVADPNGLEAI